MHTITFVDLARYGFVIEPRYYFYGWSKSPRILAEKNLARALVRARKKLPPGYNFKIWDCKRPLYVQLAMLMSFKKRIKLLYPQATPAQRATIVRSFGAAPLKRVLRPDTHRHGGAVDLTIVDRHGTELWMGTDHDDLTDRAATKYFTLNKNKAEFDRVAARNRNLLVKTLTAAGLRNYHREWWHWYVPTPQELQAEKNSP